MIKHVSNGAQLAVRQNPILFSIKKEKDFKSLNKTQIQTELVELLTRILSNEGNPKNLGKTFKKIPQDKLPVRQEEQLGEYSIELVCTNVYNQITIRDKKEIIICFDDKGYYEQCSVEIKTSFANYMRLFAEEFSK